MPNEDLAPNYEIAVAGSKLGTGVTDLISEAWVEYVDGMIWAAEITVEDKDLQLTESKVFQFGNEIDFWFGYGPRLQHMGRFVITRVEPSFPADGVPVLSVKAYTADYRMTENAPEGAKGLKGKPTVVKGKKRKDHNRAFKDKKYSDAIEDIAASYGFLPDIDTTPAPPTDMIQKAGMTDFEFLRGLANLSGFLAWVDGDEDGDWFLHFRDPERIYDQAPATATGGNVFKGLVPVQETKYTFRYNDGDFSTLISFEPQGAISQEKTRLRIAYKDPLSGRMIEEEFDEEGATPDLAFEGSPEDKVKSAPDSGGAVRLFFGDFSIETVGDKQFRNAAEAKAWATQWFRRNRENFQLGRGTIVGVESIRCFQIHALAGIGATHSGDWYFVRARHVMSRDNGYMVEFHARKVVKA